MNMLAPPALALCVQAEKPRVPVIIDIDIGIGAATGSGTPPLKSPSPRA